MSLKVGYYDPFNAFPLIYPSLETKLPLTNLHWNLEDSNSFRSIPKLPVQMVEELPKELDPDVSLRIMFIQCNTIDTYKSQVRPLIKEWLKNSINPELEWLLVLYAPVKKEKYSFKTSVYEKLRIDFGMNGKELEPLNVSIDLKERCFRLKETNDNELNKPEVYNEFATKLKELIIMSFSKSFKSLNENIERSKNKDLIYIELLLTKSRMFSNLLLLKDSLNIITEASKLLSDYNKINSNSYEFQLPSIDLENLDSFIADFKCNILEENNSFNILTYMFALKYKTLSSIIESEELASIKSLYISRIFQELILYMSELTSSRDAVLQYCFHLCNYLLESHNMTSTQTGEALDLANYYEFRGDLKMFQRSAIAKLAQLKSYRVYDLEEISLDGRKHDIEEYTQQLNKILSSEQKYYIYFERMTESTIEDYVIANRTKTVDMLSIDLAVLHYKQKDYKESLNILQNSYEFFINNGWNYMGGKLLEIYIECIESLHLKDTRLLVQSYIKLFANVVTNRIDINKPNKDKEQIKMIFKLILKHSAAPIELPILKLFNFEMDPFVYFNDMKYCISLKLLNTYGIKFVFESITLELSKGLRFTASKVKIEEDIHQSIELFNTKLTVGYYRPIRLTININPHIRLVHEFETQSDVKNSILNDSLVENYHFSTNLELDSVFLYPDNRIFNSELFCNPRILLGNPSIILKLMNGQSEVESLAVEILDVINFKYDKKVLKSINGQLKKDETSEYIIPIDLTSDSKEISLSLKITFLINGVQHEFINTKKIDLNLSISVSVHDIFKSSCIFSNFKISSAIPSPIKVISTELVNKQISDNYDIVIPKVKSSDSILHTDQIYSSFYKIMVNKNYRIKSSDELFLSVQYLSIFNECKVQIDQIIIEKLQEDGLLHYSNFYMELLAKHIKFDYQSFLIEGKLSVSNVKEITQILDSSLRFIESESSKKLRELLLNVVSKTYDTKAINNYNTLDIIVPVPNLDILQTIEYTYNKREKYLVGEPVMVQVSVESSTRWKCKTVLEELDNIQEDISIIAESSVIEEDHIESFYLNLVSDESWLVSGFKKKLMKVDFNKDSEAIKFDLVLIPLTIGNLALPKFVVKFLNSGISSDIAIKNGTESLLIVPELDKVTFSF